MIKNWTVYLQHTCLPFKLGRSKIKLSFWAFISSGKLTTVFLPCPCLKNHPKDFTALQQEEKIEFLAEPETEREWDMTFSSQAVRWSAANWTKRRNLSVLVCTLAVQQWLCQLQSAVWFRCCRRVGERGRCSCYLFLFKTWHFPKIGSAVIKSMWHKNLSQPHTQTHTGQKLFTFTTFWLKTY